MSRNAIQFHDPQSSHWESRYETGSFGIRFRVIEKLLGACDLRSQSWLDAGCGTGAISRWLADHKGCKMEGVDAAQGMIDEAVRISAASLNAAHLSFQCALIEELDFPDKFFDGVVCSSVLEYLLDPTAAIREFHRLLKPGGQLLISVPRAETRAILWTLRWLFRLTGRDQYAYFDHSRNAYFAGRFANQLGKCGFGLKNQVQFNGIDALSVIPVLRRFKDVPTLTMFLATAD